LNIPNQLSVIRFFLAGIIVVFLTIDFPYARILVLYIFILGIFTDMLDGFLARKLNQCSNLGKFIDPLADKVLMLSVFIFLVEYQCLEAWMVAIILTREFLVTGLRLILVEKKIILPADIYGKIKTVVQMSIALLYLWGLAYPGYNWLPLPHSDLSWILGIFVTLITFLSGLSYFYSCRKWIFEK